MRAMFLITLSSSFLACEVIEKACVEDPSGLQFCADRVDDDCQGGDEACPATQPTDAAPAYGCDDGEAIPNNILAHAKLPQNEQVNGGCVFVYQGETGAFYASISVVNGTDPRGPAGKSTGLCSHDFSARRHVFFTIPPTKECADVAYIYPDELANQLLSNQCRKMVRNIAQNDPDFNPDIQFLPGNLADQEERIEKFSVAEIACLRINNASGEPYRPDELFVTQAEAALTRNDNFMSRE